MDKNAVTLLVVISYYDRRSLDPLKELLKSLQDIPSGIPFDICISVNQTGELNAELQELLDDDSVFVMRRNTGMNIGAWDYAWRQYPSYSYYIFLQDECYAIKENWGSAFIEGMKKHGLVAESINDQWNLSWEQISYMEQNVKLPEHQVDGKDVNRVDYYLDYFKRNNINPGQNGRHARSLVWGMSGDVLREINGFLLGNDYGECIASEIAASKSIETLGFTVGLVGSSPFTYFRHSEWNQDYAGGPFSKKPSMWKRLKKLEKRCQQLEMKSRKLESRNADIQRHHANKKKTLAFRSADFNKISPNKYPPGLRGLLKKLKLQLGQK